MCVFRFNRKASPTNHWPIPLEKTTNPNKLIKSTCNSCTDQVKRLAWFCGYSRAASLQFAWHAIKRRGGSAIPNISNFTAQAAFFVSVLEQRKSIGYLYIAIGGGFIPLRIYFKPHVVFLFLCEHATSWWWCVIDTHMFETDLGTIRVQS